MADGRVVKCPEANISVRTPYFCGKAKALCLINPLYDLLVGNIPGASNSDTPFIGGDYLNINSATVMRIPKDKVLSPDTDMSIDIGCNITPSVEKGEVVLPPTDVEVKSAEKFTNFDSCNVIDMREKIEETCRLASEKLAESAIVSKTYYDKTAKWRYFKPGDKVLLLLTNSSNKLQLSWKGPFEVVEQVNQFDYKIQMKGKISTFHANMLKKYEEKDDEFKLDRLRGKTAPDKIETCAGLAVIDEKILLREGNDDVELPVCETQQTEDYSNVNIDKDLDENKRKELEQLIFEFQDIFTDIPGKTNLIEVELKLQRDEEIKLKPFPIPLNLRDKLNEEIDAMIKLDIIEPSTARYASPLVMIKKADGVSYRICTDYRVLNKLLINQQEPINNVEEIWSNIHGSKFYSKMDLKKGF
jgi:hypothetical protein